MSEALASGHSVCENGGSRFTSSTGVVTYACNGIDLASGSLTLTNVTVGGSSEANPVRVVGGSPLKTAFAVNGNGAFVAYGDAVDARSSGECASQSPASGAGTRFVWHPCRGAMRFGKVTDTKWDDASVGDFSFAGGNETLASGVSSFVHGAYSTASGLMATTFGLRNVVSGDYGFAAGSYNKCFGVGCVVLGNGNEAILEGSIALGWTVKANGVKSIALGVQATSGTRRGSFVWGDASAAGWVNNQADNEFRVRASGGIALRTSAAANALPGVSGNTGCDLPAGSGSWTCSSSRTVKRDFAEVDGEALLGRIAALPVLTWLYQAEPGAVRHMGPMAEDFRAAFGLGADDRTIGSQDIDGVNLAGVRALEARTRELSAANRALRAELAAQRAELAELRRMLEAHLAEGAR